MRCMACTVEESMCWMEGGSRKLREEGREEEGERVECVACVGSVWGAKVVRSEWGVLWVCGVCRVWCSLRRHHDEAKGVDASDGRPDQPRPPAETTNTQAHLRARHRTQRLQVDRRLVLGAADNACWRIAELRISLPGIA